MRCTPVALLLLGTLLSACGSDPPVDPGEPAIFPEDYAATYQQVRNCRLSIEHNGVHIRVLAPPDIAAIYNARNAPFPEGALVLKEEYADDDDDCARGPIQYTVMKKLADGADTAHIDWTWQEVDADFKETNFRKDACSHCHADCGTPEMGGYGGTCTVP